MNLPSVVQTVNEVETNEEQFAGISGDFSEWQNISPTFHPMNSIENSTGESSSNPTPPNSVREDIDIVPIYNYRDFQKELVCCQAEKIQLYKECLKTQSQCLEDYRSFFKHTNFTQTNKEQICKPALNITKKKEKLKGRCQLVLLLLKSTPDVTIYYLSSTRTDTVDYRIRTLKRKFGAKDVFKLKVWFFTRAFTRYEQLKLALPGLKQQGRRLIVDKNCRYDVIDIVKEIDRNIMLLRAPRYIKSELTDKK